MSQRPRANRLAALLSALYLASRAVSVAVCLHTVNVVYEKLCKGVESTPSASSRAQQRQTSCSTQIVYRVLSQIPRLADDHACNKKVQGQLLPTKFTRLGRRARRGPESRVGVASPLDAVAATIKN